MVDVCEYKKGQGGWLRGEDVKPGDVLTILSAGYLDDETFQDKAGKPKEYYCTDMRLLRTGIEKKVRLGPENVSRIAEAFGDNTTSWVNKDVVVHDVKTYKGLGKKGIIFKPVVESTTKTVPTKPTDQVSYLKTVILEAMTPNTVYSKTNLVEMAKVDAWVTDALAQKAVNELLESGKVRPKFDNLNLVGFTKA